MDKKERNAAQTKIFLGYLFAGLFICATVMTLLIWLLDKEARLTAGGANKDILYIGFLGIIAALIYLMYSVTAKKEQKLIENTARELRPSPFKYVADKTYRLLSLILNVIFVFYIIICLMFLTFGQLLVLVPKDVLIQAEVDPTQYYQSLLVITKSAASTAVVCPLVYIVADLLLQFFKERNDLTLQQAQDIEDIKNEKK